MTKREKIPEALKVKEGFWYKSIDGESYLHTFENGTDKQWLFYARRFYDGNNSVGIKVIELDENIDNQQELNKFVNRIKNNEFDIIVEASDILAKNMEIAKSSILINMHRNRFIEDDIRETVEKYNEAYEYRLREMKNAQTARIEQMAQVQIVCECLIIIGDDHELGAKLLTEMNVTKEMAREFAKAETYKKLEQGIFASNQEIKLNQRQVHSFKG